MCLNSDPEALARVVTDSREFTTRLAKAKTAKLVRSLIDCFDDIPPTSGGVSAQALQIDTTKSAVDWARQNARIFLAQSLETRLVALYFEAASYKDALNLINNLLRELKRLDDKMILTEVHLLESRVHHALANLAKAKAAQTSARTAANAIYCPPLLQAGLDLQSGVLLAEEKDYKTAYSYFFEALDGLSSQDDKRAVLALKYMLLCKIMLNLVSVPPSTHHQTHAHPKVCEQSEDVASIVAGKAASRYAGRDLDAMKAVAAAHSDRSLSSFEAALREHKAELTEDPIIRNHLGALYDALMESNLVKLIEPYDVVEIEHVAQQVGQPRSEVEKKLGQMILDKVFYGILDQGNGCLIAFDEPEEDVRARSPPPPH